MLRALEMTIRIPASGGLRRAPRPFTLASSEPRADASAAFFGAPLDATGSFRSGMGEGPGAIRRLSDSLETYSPAIDRALEDLILVDLGDLELEGLEVAVAVDAIADAMEDAARTFRLPVMFGGEHTLSLGGFRGIRRVHPDAALVQLDAHADLRASYEGQALTHA